MASPTGEPSAWWGRESRDALQAAAGFPHAEHLLSPAAVVSATLVLLELQLAPEHSPEPEDGCEEPERVQPCTLGTAQPKGQHQAAWKEESLGIPATAHEPGGGQSHQVEQHSPRHPSAGSQVQNWWHRLGLPLPPPGAGGPVGDGVGGCVCPYPADCFAPFPPCSLVLGCVARCQGQPGGAGSQQQVSAAPWGERWGSAPLPQAGNAAPGGPHCIPALQHSTARTFRQRGEGHQPWGRDLSPHGLGQECEGRMRPGQGPSPASGHLPPGCVVAVPAPAGCWGSRVPGGLFTSPPAAGWAAAGP